MSAFEPRADIRFPLSQARSAEGEAGRGRRCGSATPALDPNTRTSSQRLIGGALIQPERQASKPRRPLPASPTALPRLGEKQAGGHGPQPTPR